MNSEVSLKDLSCLGYKIYYPYMYCNVHDKGKERKQSINIGNVYCFILFCIFTKWY